VHARERTIRSLAVALLLAGCTPTPPEVTTGLSDDPPSGTSGSSTDTPTGPTTDGSATVASMDGTATSSGGTTEASATTLPLDDSGTTTGEPSSTSDPSGSPTTEGGMETSATTGEPADCHPLLVEVLFDAQGTNGSKQWVRLYNPCAVEIELADAYSLGWGGPDYTYGQLDLVGAIDAGDCRVVGGPEASNDNGNPVWDQAIDFNDDMQVGGDVADGVALFLGVEADITADTVPVDAVIYGIDNDSNLLDANGDTPSPHVGNTGQGESIRRTALAPTWIVEPSPMPNACPML
jgi:hypothetical protein